MHCELAGGRPASEKKAPVGEKDSNPTEGKPFRLAGAASAAVVGEDLRTRATTGRPKRHRTIIVRPFSVIASLTMPSARPPVSKIAGVAVPRPAVISRRSSLFRADNVAFPTGGERQVAAAGHCPNGAQVSRARIIAGLSGFLTVGGHGTGGEPKSVAFPRLTGRTVVILMSAFAATTGPWWGGAMIWIMFGVGTALGVGIGVAIGACVAVLTIGWWDRDADWAVRRRNS
jgi:hypothetical protein